jgi:hypothetical protein
MKKLAGSSTRLFGYDQTNINDYTFNSMGFRSQEPSQHARLAVVGNSISFGIGLSQKDIYGSILAKKLGFELDNLSFGCYLHENHDHLENIKLLAEQNQETIFIIQINNLDRVRQDQKTVICNNDHDLCLKKFLDYYDQLLQILNGRPYLLVYWDSKQFDIPDSVAKNITLRNKFHLDCSLQNNTETFGSLSHKTIANILHQIILSDKVRSG